MTYSTTVQLTVSSLTVQFTGRCSRTVGEVVWIETGGHDQWTTGLDLGYSITCQYTYYGSCTL